ncbi:MULTISPECIES: hypothetical protein [Asaia]|uniref:hypothetical protein n=1 Tax=Asaia TaxID=91914 RepID=UPI0013C4BC4B|nr:MULTISPECIES: hypothetical protein [Asaia]NIE80161.1 hypothetical protein [Asaia sp. As-1742]
MRKPFACLALLSICSLGLTGCGYDDYYGGNYYGYPGGWGRHGWNTGYTVGPHYSGRGWGGPGYRRNYDRRNNNHDNHRHDWRRH